jgi:hypothetical protein
VEKAGLVAYVVVAARATCKLLRASPRATKNFMLGMIPDGRISGRFSELMCGTEEL